MKIAESWLARATHQSTSTKCKQEVFQVLAEGRSLEELRLIEPKAREVYGRYFEELENADLKDLAIPPRRVSRLNYSRRCAEASAVQAHMKQGLPLAPGMEISYLVEDARRWEVDSEKRIGVSMLASRCLTSGSPLEVWHLCSNLLPRSQKSVATDLRSCSSKRE